MEDIPVLLLFMIIYLIAAASGGKKKKRRNGPMRTRAEGERHDMRAVLCDRQTHAGFGAVFAPAGRQEPEAHCDTQRIHLHEAAQEQFAAASEGEDPCHVGGQTDEREAPYAVEQTEEPFGQDVLRGVIMSEILIRPCERKAMQRKGFR